MKRRTFLSGLAATTAAPALPGGMLARAAAPAAALAEGNMYQVAVQWVGLWGHNSAAMLKYRFGLDEAAAQNLFQSLIDGRVIGAPDAMGMSKVLISTQRNPFLAHKMADVMEKSRAAAGAESFDATKHKPSRFRREREVVADEEFGPQDIRLARGADVEALAMIWAEGFEGGQPEVLISQKQAKLRKRLDQVVAAGPVGAPTGYALIGTQGIEEVFVARAHRNKGLGSKLLREAEGALGDVSEVVCEAREGFGFLAANGYGEVFGPVRARMPDRVHFVKVL